MVHRVRPEGAAAPTEENESRLPIDPSRRRRFKWRRPVAGTHAIKVPQLWQRSRRIGTRTSSLRGALALRRPVEMLGGGAVVYEAATHAG